MAFREVCGAWHCNASSMVVGSAGSTATATSAIAMIQA
jgi:hypothetical protein